MEVRGPSDYHRKQLFLPASFPSMLPYCIHELRLSEDCALRRLRVARLARRFPQIFPAIAEGRLSLTAVLLLRPYLTQSTAPELLRAAEHKTKSEIELFLAHRYPQADVATRMQPIARATVAVESPAPAPVQTVPVTPESPQGCAESSAPAPVETHATDIASFRAAPFARIRPLSPQRFAFQFTGDQEESQ